jgi:uncharacterized protein
MRFLLQDLQHDPIEFRESLAPSAIDYTDDIRQTGPLTVEGRVDLVEEHHGPNEIVEDIRIRAHYSGEFELPCARCIEPVAESLSGDFDLLYRPAGLPVDVEEHSITTSETEIGYYQGDGLDLEDVLREQVLLTLPARVLCQPDCKGLCPHCGQNLNTTSCTCENVVVDPRWNALADLRNRVKP